MVKIKAPSKPKLAPRDYDPLLVAIGSRSVDTCLLGTKCLALLEDPRAFGLLMQLSCESSPEVRLETCHSFEQLGDHRAKDRLCALLDDNELMVRDAAFTALAKICSNVNEPLVAAIQGMAVQYEDIRLRGLELLIRYAKKSKSNLQSENVKELLIQALNDSNSVRSEAFKFVLNSKIGGGEDATLKFLLGSVHSDVRRDVLNEIMAEEKQPWFEQMITEMLNDPDPSIRKEALECLAKKNKDTSKSEQVNWLAAAVESEHIDIRLEACQRLVKLNTPESQTVLAGAINDDSLKIRQFALQSLIDRNETKVLLKALESSYVEIKLAAATALAGQGNKSARPVLEAFVNIEMPTNGKEQQKLWQMLTAEALDGLAKLEDPETLNLFIDKSTHENSHVRKRAAAGLQWVANSNSVELLQPLIRHEKMSVRLSAALASALHGDILSGRMVLAPDSNTALEDIDQLCVAVALHDTTENQLIQMLDMDSSILYPNSALIVLLCRDWLKHDGSPRRIVAALAARDARLRLIAASALQLFSETEKLGQVIVDLFNNRAENEPFKIDPEVVRTIASILVFGKAPLLRHTIELLDLLAESKQDPWNNAWYWISQRYSKEINEAISTAAAHKCPDVSASQETLQQLSFGTYVGLTREQGGYHTLSYYPRFGWSIANVRQVAIERLKLLALENSSFLDPTINILTHTCGDPLQPVRKRALDALSELGVPDKRRAEIGIACGNLDLAVLGLGLLTQSATKSERKAILTQAIFDQNDSIGIEAAKMLREEIGSVETCKVCMESANDSVAIAAVNWVAEDYSDKSIGKDAKLLLRQLANDSPDYLKTRSIDALVRFQDEKAFDAVAKLVGETNPSINRKRCFRWFGVLGDPRACELLLDLLDDPNLDIDQKSLLDYVGEFRAIAVVPKLLQLMERTDIATNAANVLLKISGFDQRILDPNDEWPDRLWVDTQHPRHGDVLGKLMSRAIELNLPILLKRYIESARWCLTDEVNAPLSRLVTHPNEQIRRNAIEAIGFRAQKRKGSVEVLKSSIAHRDPLTQFLAAESLAKAGQDDGLQVLMSAVEMMDELNLRRRAVLAMGHLADERALDPLLKLVTHDAHALQDCAAEAIGHLGNSEHKEKIFQHLSALVSRQGSAGERALVGLRHMDTPEGWDKIRAEARSELATSMRYTAWLQLGFDQSPATKDLLIELLKKEDEDGGVLLASARQSLGLDSVLPDLAYLEGQKECYTMRELELECLHNVFKKATPSQIFELITHCPEEAQPRLANHLMSLDPLPIEESLIALSNPDAKAVILAAHVIGRDGNKKNANTVKAVLETLIENYSAASEHLKLQNRLGNTEFLENRKALNQLIWSAGRLGGSENELLNLLVSHPSDEYFLELRQSAIDALQGSKLSATQAKKLNELLNDYDPVIRNGAGSLMVTLKKTNANVVADAFLADRRAFEQLARSGVSVEETIHNAVSSSHYQPRAIPHLIADSDSQALASVATDNKLDLLSRLGAIEGLAKLATKDADQSLIDIGKDESVDEVLRKASWKGLRRSKRIQEMAHAK
ncbi:MAG: HEAT repeat domain-containing protein [Candidatus Thiodiazotropha sp.]